jgi:glycosyltransferase involved in cell wall biosynthesis
MKISYAIAVCNESRELYSLINFLKEVKEPGDDIDVLVDSAHVSNSVQKVIKYFEGDINVYNRDFVNGDFSEHRNFQISKCTGDVIFIIDADEMPQESIVKLIPEIFEKTGADIIAIPRMNMCPGASRKWLSDRNFSINQLGWINWPDYQRRIFKNNIGLTFNNSLHEMISGSEKIYAVQADPELGLWHIKSTDKQDNRWENHCYSFPKNDNLYDELM